MSRQELAEAVNAYLWETHNIVEHLDRCDIGKLERGENRWPNVNRREAFRAVLDVRSDAELGFWIIRGQSAARHVDQPAASEASQASEASVTAGAEAMTGTALAKLTGAGTPGSDHRPDTRSAHPLTCMDRLSADGAGFATLGEADYHQLVKELVGWAYKMNRRDLLYWFSSVAGVAAAAPALGGFDGQAAQPSPALDAVRRTLVSRDAVIGAPDEWERIAWEYSCSYRTREFPDAWVADLAADLADLGARLDATPDGSDNRTLSRAAGQMAAMMAMGLESLGQFGPARRWWRTAKHAADTTGEPETRTWVRGLELVQGLYTPRPLQTALDLADEVSAITTQPCGGTAKALAGKAQALALMGRDGDATQALAAAGRLFERLPDDVTAERGSIFDWPEYCLRHTESFVYSHLGRTAAAYQAQDRAFDIYPAAAGRSQDVVRLHRAICHIHDGDIGDGAELALKTVAAIPARQRTILVRSVTRRVVDAVPMRERHRSTVTALQELVAPTGGPALWN